MLISNEYIYKILYLELCSSFLGADVSFPWFSPLGEALCCFEKWNSVVPAGRSLLLWERESNFGKGSASPGSSSGL